MSMLVDIAKQKFSTPFGGILEVVANDGDERFCVDARTDKVIVSATLVPDVENDASVCVWRASREVLLDILQSPIKRRDSHFISGRLMISGDMAVMSRLDQSLNHSGGERQ